MTAISVFGLGYVGCVSAACFAKEGNTVVGVDVSPAKVDLVNSGKSTILEDGIADLVADVVRAGRLRATTDVRDAIANSSISLICVGTPSRQNGGIDLKYVERVCMEIGACLKDKAERHTIVMRSTVLPGTNDDLVIPTLEKASGKKAGIDFGVCSNPEFLREGTSIRDFYDPPFTVIGARTPEETEPVQALYAGIKAPVRVTALRVAETIKYACNSFHGLKVGFANEIGNICKALEIDSHEVMRIFCEDTKLNISPYYLRPGFAFGGSCLPKDLRALTYKGRQVDVETPILTATLESNRRQIVRAYDMIAGNGRKRIGILGMAFKAGTDDLRESPMVTLIEMLIGRGMQIAIYDRHVSSANLMGANKEYIEKEIPHIWTMMRDNLDDVLSFGETIIIGNGASEFKEIRPKLRPGQTILDLVRIFGPSVTSSDGYVGFAW